MSHIWRGLEWHVYRRMRGQFAKKAPQYGDLELYVSGAGTPTWQYGGGPTRVPSAQFSSDDPIDLVARIYLQEAIARLVFTRWDLPYPEAIMCIDDDAAFEQAVAAYEAQQ